MILLLNNDDYVWMDEDENFEFSPRFENKQDALVWYGRVAKDILSEFGVDDE